VLLHYDTVTDKTTEKEIDITAPVGELDRFIEIEIDKMRKDLAIKGFRKGKVPISLIKTRYRDSLKAQAINDLVTEYFLKIIAEKKWRPASQAEMKNFEEDSEAIKFRLCFETIPDFKIADYIGIEVYQDEALPEDFLIEQVTKNLREQYAKVVATDRPAVVDDIITMDIKISENDQIKEDKQDIVINIGNRDLPDELNKALVGIKKDERKKINIDKSLYEIHVKKIEEKTLPEIDDAFAKSHNYEGLDQLRTKLLENARINEERRLEETVKESISNILLERNQFEVPKTMTESEYHSILQRMNLPESDSNKERFWKPAENRVRLDLLISKIAEKENIKIEDKEIMDLVKAMSIKLNEENRKNVINYLGNLLVREKTMDLLYKNAKISKKSRIISPKEDINDTRSIRHRTNRPR
jgi:trigger factor